MSDTEVEKYETKIKDALLRRDSNLSTVSSALKEIVAGSVEVNGKNMYLSDFGIETLSYFTAAENEKNATTLMEMQMTPAPPVMQTSLRA